VTKSPKDTVIVIGAGSHGRMVADLAQTCGLVVSGFVDNDRSLHGRMVNGFPVIGDDEHLALLKRDDFLFANGIGSTGKVIDRRLRFEQLLSEGYRFPVLLHPRAIVAGSVPIGPGSLFMAGAIVQPGCRIDRNVIVNTGATVEHDCTIGPHTHIATRATLCGSVEVGEAAHIGAGSVVIQCCKIGSFAVLGAGTVVLNDVAPGSTVVGVPAKVRPSRYG
jgi:sugar O-acyltransferase (sialic acid O-acetyltransferase NeuD family)